MRRNGIQPAGGGRRGLHWDGSWVIVDAACADVDCLAKLAATRSLQLCSEQGWRNPQPHGAACRDAQPVTAWPSLPRRAARNRVRNRSVPRSPQPHGQACRDAQLTTVLRAGLGSQPATVCETGACRAARNRVRNRSGARNLPCNCGLHQKKAVAFHAVHMRYKTMR